VINKFLWQTNNITIEELLEIVFSVWSDPRIYSELPLAVALIPVWRQARIPPP
jgi:hypothetical protein